ncbi:MAG: hypothetical protein J7K26_01515, partial [Candidatus Aenigmarchaeota archaeon]|nr:hypothetical protein [Candidatus Aenigmarchaeota archaeon]
YVDGLIKVATKLKRNEIISNSILTDVCDFIKERIQKASKSLKIDPPEFFDEIMINIQYIDETELINSIILDHKFVEEISIYGTEVAKQRHLIRKQLQQLF